MTTKEIMAAAHQVKQNMDNLTLLGDQLYICLDCKQVTDYWKPGQICESCERLGEEQQEYGR